MGSSEKVTTATLVTGRGAGGIAVILLRGPATRTIVTAVVTPRHQLDIAGVGAPRLVLGELIDQGQRLDEVLLSLRPGVDGDIAEINIHGGPRVAQRALRLLERQGATVTTDSPARSADSAVWPLAAGELKNPAIGQELLETLPEATTAHVVSMLTQQWSGGISRLALVAAEAIDGAPGATGKLATRLHVAADRLSVMTRLLTPPEVVLAGPPNAGKSSLANALLARQACIVTDMAGTTRDWVREIADLHGCGVWLTDTAGLWAPDDPLDREAVDRAWRCVDKADLVVAVFDASAPPTDADEHWRHLLREPNVLLVANKADLAPPTTEAIGVDALTGRGLGQLRDAIGRRLGLGDLPHDGEAAFTQRQARLLHLAAESIEGGLFGDAAAALADLRQGG